jgi:hypothetical protein
MSAGILRSIKSVFPVLAVYIVLVLLIKKYININYPITLVQINVDFYYTYFVVHFLTKLPFLYISVKNKKVSHSREMPVLIYYKR